MQTPQILRLVHLTLLLIPFLCAIANAVEPKDTLVYVGTYTAKESKGIYVFKLQTTGMEVSQNITLVPLGLAAETSNPSFLIADYKRRLIFAVNENEKGSVSSFAVDPPTGKLNLLNQQPSGGAGPCHLVLDKSGRNLLVANYDSGSVAVLPVSADGHLGEASCVIQHTGHSVNPKRQAGPHAHCVTLDPDNHFAYVCDLGLDKVMIYHFDADHGKLTPNDPPFATLKPGTGPRHMVFRPDGKFAYTINEIDSTITAFSFNPKTGGLTELQTLSSLPAYYDGPNSGAEIAVHPNGKFLYASNRGNETIVNFEIDSDKGSLTFIEEQNTGGRTPRNFGIEPSAKHMAICNQNSDTVLASRIDAGNGRLKPSGVFAKVPAPVCAIFLPPPGDLKPSTQPIGD